MQYEEDGSYCKRAQRCSQEYCLEQGSSSGYFGLVWNGLEYNDHSGGTTRPCCSDACGIAEGEYTCHCWSYAQENPCECFGVAPYNFADGAEPIKKCACSSYRYSHKKECCELLNGIYNSGRDTCSATIYEWKISSNEIWRNGYTCPSSDIIGSVCNMVLRNSYYFTNPEIDNLPICSDSCTSSQLGSKCKYCEVTYSRVCPGYSSGGSAESVKKTKTCVKSQKVL